MKHSGTANASAQVSLGRRMYSLGKKLVRERQVKTVLARFDPDQKEWVFLTENEEELVITRLYNALRTPGSIASQSTSIHWQPGASSHP